MTYCISCAFDLLVELPLQNRPLAKSGICAICTKETDVLPESHYGRNRERLNPAALSAKLRRARTQPTTH